MHHPVEFRHFRSAATCYGMRQSSVYSLRVEDWIMLLFGWFFPLPCLRAPGRGVPGFLAGPALVFCCCFSSMIQILSFVIFTRMSHVSHSAQRAPPQFENHVQIFHLSSTDDERTGPGYMNQLACEQKKKAP